MAELTSDEIEAVMDQCDSLTEVGFRKQHNFGPSRDYWVISPYRSSTKLYPTKPIAAVALKWADINGGYSQYNSACNVLERAGYSIVDREGKVVVNAAGEATDPQLLINLSAKLSQTEREQIIRARVGQPIFRAKLMKLARARCEVTGLTERALLVASHIKPWSRCDTDFERLDEQNGLLLSALWDAAFDEGLVTFDESGLAMFSPHLKRTAKRVLTDGKVVPIRVIGRRREHLRWHRKHCYKSA